MGKGYEKQKRYTRKRVMEGRCPHCGKPCAPYYECEERRMNRRVYVCLRRMMEAGAARREWTGCGHPAYWFPDKDIEMRSNVSGREGDSRFLPREDNKPNEFDDIILEILRQNPKRGMTDAEVWAELGKRRQARIDECKNHETHT